MDWKKWRSEGLGASDAAAVLGVSPWTTRYQLWEEKAGVAVRDQSNWATKRGNELEPKARAHYELTTGREMPVAFVEHSLYPFIRASLDGYNEAESIVLEIKCPGKDDHATALEGKVPEKYYPQLQHQLLVTGAKMAHYYSFDGEGSFALVEVLPDFIFINNLFDELCAFWDLVKTKTPPELVDKDFKKIKSKEVIELAETWKVAKAAAEQAAALEDTAKKQLLAALGEDHARFLVGDVKVSRVSRIGAVDYGKIPELKTVNLEDYRKKSSSYWTVKK